MRGMGGILCVAVALLQGCGGEASPLGARHKPSGFNANFSGDGLAFQDYVTQSRAMIEKIVSAVVSVSTPGVWHSMMPRPTKAASA